MQFKLGWSKTIPAPAVSANNGITRDKDFGCVSSRAYLDKSTLTERCERAHAVTAGELYEEIRANSNWYDNGRQRIIIAIANMTVEQQREFAADVDLQHYIASLLDHTLGERGVPRVVAHLLLDSIAAGRLMSPHDIYVKLAKHATAIFSCDTDIVADVSEAFQEDEALLETVVNPGFQAEVRLSHNFSELLRHALSARAFETSGIKLLRYGYVPLAERVNLDAGFSPNKEKIIRELLNATSEEKCILMQDSVAGRALRSCTMDWLNDKQKDFVLQAWGQFEFRGCV